MTLEEFRSLVEEAKAYGAIRVEFGPDALLAFIIRVEEVVKEMRTKAAKDEDLGMPASIHEVPSLWADKLESKQT